MIESLLSRLLALLDACTEERLALAELHRAQAKQALAAPTRLGAEEEAPDADAFIACEHRATEAFMYNLLVKDIPCPYHGNAPGQPCPEEVVQPINPPLPAALTQPQP